MLSEKLTLIDDFKRKPHFAEHISLSAKIESAALRGVMQILETLIGKKLAVAIEKEEITEYNPRMLSIAKKLLEEKVISSISLTPQSADWPPLYHFKVIFDPFTLESGKKTVLRGYTGGASLDKNE